MGTHTTLADRKLLFSWMPLLPAFCPCFAPRRRLHPVRSTFVWSFSCSSTTSSYTTSFQASLPTTTTTSTAVEAAVQSFGGSWFLSKSYDCPRRCWTRSVRALSLPPLAAKAWLSIVAKSCSSSSTRSQTEGTRAKENQHL